MRVAFYSGSFNPIHNGHLALAKCVLEQANVDEVWFSVTPNNPLKQAEDLWDTALRIRLVEQALQGEKGLQLTDIEQHLPVPSYTIHTLQALTETYPQHQFALLIGSDNMACFQQWYKWQDLLTYYPLIVYPREGDDMESLKQLYPTMKVLENVPLFPVSSTEIRQRLSVGNSIAGLVPAAVEQTILALNL